MTRSFEDYVANARYMAGLTQEQATERLSLYVSGRENIGCRSISRYENGSPIPEAVINAMKEVYQAHELTWIYLSTKNEVGKNILPEIKLLGLPNAVSCLEMIISKTDEEIEKFKKAAFERRLNGEVEELLVSLKMLIGIAASSIIAIEKERTAPAKERWKQLAYKIHEKSPLCRAD